MSHSRLGLPSWWILIAKVVSIVFHPLLVGVYMAFYMIFVNDAFYRYMDPGDKVLILATIVNNNFIFPVVVVLLLKALGFARSIYLETQKERIVPYMASIIFFFWTWYVFYSRPETPGAMKDMLQGIFYSSIMAMVANIYFKISMHAIGMGGLMGLMLIVLFDGNMMSGLPLMISILLTGLVMSSRLIASDHQKGDIAAGFLAGFLAQVLAATIL